MSTNAKVETLVRAIERYTNARFEELYRARLTRRTPLFTEGLGSGHRGRGAPPNNDIGMYPETVPSPALDELRASLEEVLKG